VPVNAAAYTRELVCMSQRQLESQTVRTCVQPSPGHLEIVTTTDVYVFTLRNYPISDFGNLCMRIESATTTGHVRQSVSQSNDDQHGRGHTASQRSVSRIPSGMRQRGLQLVRSTSCRWRQLVRSGCRSQRSLGRVFKASARDGNPTDVNNPRVHYSRTKSLRPG